jgi:predicted  nucleic acid-binding Zn-ribbon protein
MFNLRKEGERDVIKDAFEKVKEDIFNLSNDISHFRIELLELKNEIKTINNELTALKVKEIHSKNPILTGFYPTDNPTHAS